MTHTYIKKCSPYRELQTFAKVSNWFPENHVPLIHKLNYWRLSRILAGLIQFYWDTFQFHKFIIPTSNISDDLINLEPQARTNISIRLPFVFMTEINDSIYINFWSICLAPTLKNVLLPLLLYCCFNALLKFTANLIQTYLTNFKCT